MVCLKVYSNLPKSCVLIQRPISLTVAPLYTASWWIDSFPPVGCLTVWCEGCQPSHTVGIVKKAKKEPWHKQSVSSFFSELSLCPPKKSKVSRDTRKKKEHGHLPDIHEANPYSCNPVSPRAPTKALHIPGSSRGISHCCVKEKDAPSESDPHNINIRPPRWSCQLWHNTTTLNNLHNWTASVKTDCIELVFSYQELKYLLIRTTKDISCIANIYTCHSCWLIFTWL